MRILNHPVATEKAIRMMDAENKLIFDVSKSATKAQVSEAFQYFFDVKPVKINTMIRSDGRKRAIVTLPADKPAIDIATNLGML